MFNDVTNRFDDVDPIGVAAVLHNNCSSSTKDNLRTQGENMQYFRC